MSLIFKIINEQVAGLAGSFTVNPDSCENPDYYRHYLQWMAYGDLLSGENTTHVLYDDESNRIVGFVSLRANAVISRDQVAKGKPALEISVLAVDQQYERKGIGSLLIDKAISEADWLHKNSLGINYIVLVADHKAVGFYEKCKFSKISDYSEIPREDWNVNCVPMILKLDFWEGESFATEDDEEEETD